MVIDLSAISTRQVFEVLTEQPHGIEVVANKPIIRLPGLRQRHLEIIYAPHKGELYINALHSSLYERPQDKVRVMVGSLERTLRGGKSAKLSLGRDIIVNLGSSKLMIKTSRPENSMAAALPLGASPPLPPPANVTPVAARLQAPEAGRMTEIKEKVFEKINAAARGRIVRGWQDPSGCVVLKIEHDIRRNSAMRGSIEVCFPKGTPQRTIIEAMDTIDYRCEVFHAAGPAVDFKLRWNPETVRRSISHQPNPDRLELELPCNGEVSLDRLREALQWMSGELELKQPQIAKLFRIA